MLILDANVLVSAALGRSRSLIEATAARGLDLLVPIAQRLEAATVLVRLGGSPVSVETSLGFTSRTVRVIEPEAYDGFEPAARARLGAHGQSDWPVLAAALALEADIWSNDRDFFGLGVAVWTTRNVGYATAT